MVSESSSTSGNARPGRAGHGLRRVADLVLSLQCRTTILVVFLTLAVTSGVVWYVLHSAEQLARHQSQARMVQMASMLAKAASVPLTSEDQTALETLASEAANGSPLLYVIVSDVRGRQLAVAEYRSAGILRAVDGKSKGRAPVPGRPMFRTGSAATPIFLDITYPITTRPGEANTPSTQVGRDQKLLGYVRTGMLANEWHRTMSSTLDFIVGVGLLAALAVVPFGFLLVRRLFSPLDGLTQVMDRFSQGELDVRSPLERNDEIGRLAVSFNRMADQYQHTHERILRLNAELEKRVAQRTQQLRELASREPLTGLYNRRHFNEMLERRFGEARRYDNALSCLMFDLDGFKIVNDAFGHHVGDELLILTAGTILSQLRGSDVPARFGGDEFVVLLPHTDADNARSLAERIVHKFNEDLLERLPQVHVTMSVGIASAPAPGIHDMASFLRAADHALYDAKAGGKNRIVAAGPASNPVAF